MLWDAWGVSEGVGWERDWVGENGGGGWVGHR